MTEKNKRSRQIGTSDARPSYILIRIVEELCVCVESVRPSDQPSKVSARGSNALVLETWKEAHPREQKRWVGLVLEHTLDEDLRGMIISLLSCMLS